MTKNKALFLDRDGILNKALVDRGKPLSPRTIKDLKINFFLKKYLNKLRKNYLLIVISNQPDVAKNLVKKNIIERQNKILKKFFLINDFFVCYHQNKDKCKCRKPKIGLIKFAKKKYNINLSKSILIGDRWKDISAGNKAGCRSVYIDFGYKETRPKKFYKKFLNLKSAFNFLSNE
jgi:D-glycero-D-manno-heptose 1,7-bisphosphate phosphatase